MTEKSRLSCFKAIFYTYIIYSSVKDVYYIGQTNNLTDRLHRHNTDQNRYTKGKGPWVLVYSKVFDTRSEAVQLERKLKGFKNKEYLKKWIGQQYG